jgi:uncharacterized alpha/beta hydrolase family protein
MTNEIQKIAKRYDGWRKSLAAVASISMITFGGIGLFQVAKFGNTKNFPTLKNYFSMEREYRTLNVPLYKTKELEEILKYSSNNYRAEIKMELEIAAQKASEIEKMISKRRTELRES